MPTGILLFILASSLGALLFNFFLYQHFAKQPGDLGALAQRLTSLEQALGRLEPSLRQEFAQSRQDAKTAALESQSFLWKNMQEFRDAQEAVRASGEETARKLREEVGNGVRSIGEQTERALSRAADLQHQKLGNLETALVRVTDKTEERLEAVRITVAASLKDLQQDNRQQLEQMRLVVEEKLQGTLEQRLGESFSQVSQRLEQVHKGLGEMQSIATGVGDLKRVLGNVKTRGLVGEIQLGKLLSDTMSPSQYVNNYAPFGAGETVEYAIQLPGQNTDTPVYLPIDAKFPIEDYRRLLEAHEQGDLIAQDQAGKALEQRIKTCARDISQKYLNPPHTTNFGILFLPTEGLFAEVIRRSELVQYLQQDRRIVIAGPTTLWSILSSLQLGFQTLALQKRSSEVWDLLAAIKSEWTKYGDVLEKVKKRLDQASGSIDEIKRRNSAVGRKLRQVEEAPDRVNASLLLGLQDEMVESL